MGCWVEGEEVWGGRGGGVGWEGRRCGVGRGVDEDVLQVHETTRCGNNIQGQQHSLVLCVCVRACMHVHTSVLTFPTFSGSPS